MLAGLEFHKQYQILAAEAGGDQDSVGGGAPLDKEYEMLLDALGFEPATIDTLVARSGFPASRFPRCC